MKNIFFLLFCLTTISGFSQIHGEDEVYLIVDRVEPTFDGGGLNKFHEYVNKNFDFSKVTKLGRMITPFTINEFGEIKNIKVVQFVDIESAIEIVRVLKNCPNWEPAKRGGKSISVEINFPLDFKMNRKFNG